MEKVQSLALDLSQLWPEHDCEACNKLGRQIDKFPCTEIVPNSLKSSTANIRKNTR